MTQNRFLSDLRKQQIDLENYIEKYLPYNTMVEVFKMLNQTVQDGRFFNELVEYEAIMKQNFIHDHLERLSGRVFSLDKRKILDFEIPRKRKVYQEFVVQAPQTNGVQTPGAPLGTSPGQESYNSQVEPISNPQEYRDFTKDPKVIE